MQKKPLEQRLDDLSRASGLYRLSMIERPVPRNLRWTPLVVLFAMIAGYSLLQAAHRGPLPFALAATGVALFGGGFLAANFVRFMGPRLIPDFGKTLDERESLLKARARSISGAILTIAAVGGCFWFGFASTFGGWMPTDASDWIQLALLIEGCAFALPVLIASWLQPPDITDEDYT